MRVLELESNIIDNIVPSQNFFRAHNALLLMDLKLNLTFELFLIVGLFLFVFYLGFTPCKTERPPQGMDLQEKEV